MKVLTLHQPWATLIAIGAKTVETRAWQTSHRGPVAIHAAKRFDDSAKQRCYESPVFDALCRVGAEAFPSRGPCAICGGSEARHREIDAIVEAVAAGDSAEYEANCHAVSVEAVHSLVAGHPDSLPLGAVVAIAELVDVLPIRTDSQDSRATGKPFVALDDFGIVRIWRPWEKGHGWEGTPATEHEASFGYYAPGRFAWILRDVRQCLEPLPARGSQGLWDWDPPSDIAGRAG